MELFEASSMDEEERIIKEFNKDAEEDDILDIYIFFEDDYDEV